MHRKTRPSASSALPFLALLSVAFFSVSCASGGPEPTPDPVLGFVVPSAPSATYHVTDTTTLSIDTPMGAVEVGEASLTTLDMVFADDPGGVRVTAEVSAFDATTSNDMAGTQTSDMSDVEGAFEFVLDARGAVDVVSAPKASGAAAERARFETMVYSLFPRLPNRRAEPGLAWVDTVTWSVEDGSDEVASTTVYSYTLMGDTIVDGRRLAVIDVRGEGEVAIAGSESGMAMEMTLSATESGSVLWDMQRGRLHASEMDHDLAGAMSMNVGGVQQMNVSATGRLRVWLDAGTGSSQ